MSKVWFITGSSRGFGRVWAEAALARGDKVAATARTTETLQPLVDAYGKSVPPLALDVADKAAVDAAVRRAHEIFGRLEAGIRWSKSMLPVAAESGKAARARGFELVAKKTIAAMNARPTV